MRYLGCKTKIADKIVAIALKHEKKTIIDPFTGTGSMAEAFAEAGFNVIASDIMKSCCVLVECKLKMTHALPSEVLDKLNDKSTYKEGFVFSNYSKKGQREYFTEENAGRIDGVREYIDTLSEPIKTHALGCLIEPVSCVSNTTGTYGAWCKTMDPRSVKEILLTDCFVLKPNPNNHKVIHGRAIDVLSSESYDIAYIDPPYNTRQYGANYHVLETITRNDTPDIHGKTGIRNWEDTKSIWCYKGKVHEELENTIKSCKCNVILMSYNNEGIMTMNEIVSIMNKYGEVKVHTIKVSKYKTKTHNDSEVDEYVFELIMNKKLYTDNENIVQNLDLINKIEYNNIYNIDCILGMNMMEDSSVDMILCDPPFGLTECEWDKIIDIKAMFNEFTRLIKPDGAIVVFCQQPFTSKIVLNGIDTYKYSLVWKKSKKGNFAQAPYRFMCEHEDIIVFSKGKTAKNGKPRMKYNPQGLQDCNKKMKGKTGDSEHRNGRKTQSDYIQTKTGYPSSILEFNNESGFHPTQKPVALFEYLIRTYTNNNDIVLDACMGSGTTAIASIKSQRMYIGFETNKDYYDKSLKRISDIAETST